MIKFIIVEDNNKTVKQVEEIIKKSLFGYDINYEKIIYNKYDKNLAKEIEDKSYIKIYIMDIELENSISGIEISKKIRNEDWESIIIFITTHDNMFETVYRSLFNIYDFIEKFENMDKRLSSDLKEIAKHNFDYKTYKYKNNNVDIMIYYKSINYFTRDTNDRKIIINTDNNEFYIKTNIKDLEKALDDRFIKVSRSTIINKDNVEEINWNKGYFILKNGKILYLVTKDFNKRSKK